MEYRDDQYKLAQKLLSKIINATNLDSWYIARAWVDSSDYPYSRCPCYKVGKDSINYFTIVLYKESYDIIYEKEVLISCNKKTFFKHEHPLVCLCAKVIAILDLAIDKKDNVIYEVHWNNLSKLLSEL
jgi:hypothetical protein